MVYAKYNYGISMGYTHRQTEGHLLLTIHYLVRGVSNTFLTGHVEILIVQQLERALLLVGVCARSGRGGSAVSPAPTVPPHVPEACKDIIGYDKPSKDIVQL